MANRRFLTWYIKGGLSPLINVGPAYRLTEDYVPISISIDTREPVTRKIQSKASTPTRTVFDINDDGVSIFSSNPELIENETYSFEETPAAFNRALTLEKGSWITLDIDSVGENSPGEDVSVQLELEERETNF